MRACACNVNGVDVRLVLRALFSQRTLCATACVCVTNYVMFSLLFVCLCVCLSVCLSAKTCERICMKFSGKVGNGPMDKRLNFGGDRITDQDDPYRDTGKTCLGGGLLSPCASSY